MSSPKFGSENSLSAEQAAQEVVALYHKLIEAWNKHSATNFGALFTEDGETIGFDGSQLIGKAEITSTLQQIFADHVTAPYTVKVKNVRIISPTVAILRGIAGMVPAGQSELNPALNAVHNMVAARSAGNWQISLFQNTPAQLHGRPELVQQMTEELCQSL